MQNRRLPESTTITALWIAVFGLFLLIIALVIDLAILPEVGPKFIEEGAVERFAAFLYLPAVILFFRIAPASEYGRLWHIPVLLMLFMARELDFDKAFTDRGILSLRHYSGDAPLMEKLIGGLVLLLIITATARLLLIGARPLLEGLKSRDVWAFCTFGAGLLVVTTKTVDGLARKLEPFDIVPGETLLRCTAVLEEAGEMLIPVAIILAIFTRWPRGAR